MLDIGVNSRLLWVHADFNCIINCPKNIHSFRRGHAESILNKLHTHRFTGTKMFNRRAGDGLILCLGPEEGESCSQLT